MCMCVWFFIYKSYTSTIFMLISPSINRQPSLFAMCVRVSIIDL